MSGKTVFISYRHDDTSNLLARLLKQELTHYGYDVFLDVDNIAGKWAKEILTEVPKRSHFLLLLTPNCFDRCSDPNDWVRQEFETAVKHERNIVPVRGSSLDISQLRQASPTSMASVFDYQAASFRHDAFDQDVERLVNHHIPPHRAPAEAAPEIFSIRSSHRTSPANFDISRIDKYAPEKLIGRETEIGSLNDAWDQVMRGEKGRPHILTFVALGGEGKTSLIAKWAAALAHQDWPGCDAVFAWSFYSQGTREQTQASSDTFLAEGLRFFGDEETAGSAKSGYEKGKRLAHLVGEKRALLILDGVEPLQYAPGPPMDAKLKDEGLAVLLKSLAATNRGLCIVTTRYSIPDLKAFRQTTAPETKLASLSREAGVHLLKTLGVNGTEEEFDQLVADVRGHALTLNLLGTYLRDAHGGDIRKRDLVKLEEADAEEQSGHAFHVMDAYVASLKSGGQNGLRALSVLRLLGLFDRPASADCLDALWTGAGIAELTGPLIGLTEAQRNLTLTRLEDAKLITVNREQGSARLISIDAHPLLRECFASRVREQFFDAWRAAHLRIYEHLCGTTEEGDEPTLGGLQPLYQAVAHGCHAGMQADACKTVYKSRILRDDENYSTFKLGALASDLGAIACFFDEPWRRVSSALKGTTQAWLMNEAAFTLRALGRLTEAVEPMRLGLRMRVEQEEWQNAASSASNLSEMELTLGEVALALRDAEKCLTYADRSGDALWQCIAQVKLGHALHQSGRRAEAESRFREAERMQREVPPHTPLYSLRGFLYCELLLAVAERAVGRVCLKSANQSETQNAPLETLPLNATCESVYRRAEEMLRIAEERNLSLLTRALDYLMLGRSALYAAILRTSELRLVTSEVSHIATAVAGFRRASTSHHIPGALLTRALLRSLTGAGTGAESAQEDLDEAWEIAERGPMRLHMADIHLYRARLFHAVKPYPWNKFEHGREGRGPKDDLDAAEELINECGYHRRDEELADAKEAAKNWD